MFASLHSVRECVAGKRVAGIEWPRRTNAGQLLPVQWRRAASQTRQGFLRRWIETEAVSRTSQLGSPDGAAALPCPYTPAAKLHLGFTPEGSESSFPLDVRVTEAFDPFTVAQCLVVEPTSPRHDLPSRFIVKLFDYRFSNAGSESRSRPWTTRLDVAFKQGFKRIKSGAIENIWCALGGPGYGYGDLFPGEPEWEADWMPEMNRWDDLLGTHRREVAAYRYLTSLQGRDIPRMYGTCRYRLPDASEDTDPMIANVPGIVLEYIEGQSMDKLILGRDISEQDAERASLGLLSIIRKLRASKSLHNDIAPRNVIVRRDDFDHPVLIDFGCAAVKQPDVSDELWHERTSGCHELTEARSFLKDKGWHNPSPWRWRHELTHTFYGYRRTNREVAAMRPDWRDQKFEFVPGFPDETKVDEDGNKHRWEPLRWRIKPGVKTCDDDR
ncbi:hypothetical protein PLICRDRAFT_56725 [Plicaturopsis crispa FD-325 SS-3]|nr:hypothetical protein PLICRDRAFT_56725 [Plicaturopsis crispa FD-325 SS-3]